MQWMKWLTVGCLAAGLAGCGAPPNVAPAGAVRAEAAQVPAFVLPPATEAQPGSTTTYPMIAVACEAFAPRASTFDCLAANAVRTGSVTVDNSAPASDQAIVIRRAYLALSAAATDDCGGPDLCRGAYGVIGYQCLAIAQSAFFSGFGSFMGTETTRSEAEQTALDNCQYEVGDPGAECQIVISQCAPGID